MKIWIIVVLLCVTACGGIPEGVKPITGFELPRYLGRWHEIARFDHSFERGLTDITAEYSMRDDGGVRVVNSGYNAERGERVSVEGRAYFVATPDVGRLEVSFFGPFFGGYNIIALDKQRYSHVMIAGPDHNYLWILARTPTLSAEVLADLVAQAKMLGFATEHLIYAERGHDKN